MEAGMWSGPINFEGRGRFMPSSKSEYV